MGKEACSGSSPWNGSSLEVKQAMALYRMGVNIAGMTPAEIEQTYLSKHDAQTRGAERLDGPLQEVE